MTNMTVKECCCFLKKLRNPSRAIQHARLASETLFSINEIEALYDLFEGLSYAIIEDGRIHKEEFLLALFSNSSMQNFFADRLFDTFDIKKNGVIEFDEFVRSLSVFHPDAPESVKIEFMFRLYDLKHNGFIERDELKEMVLALLSEMNVDLSEDAVEDNSGCGSEWRRKDRYRRVEDIRLEKSIHSQEYDTSPSKGDHSSVSKLRDTYQSPRTRSSSMRSDIARISQFES